MSAVSKPSSASKSAGRDEEIIERRTLRDYYIILRERLWIALPLALPAAVNLTAEGTRDWIHWGLSASDSVDRKSSVTPQISSFTKIGSNTVERYNNNYTAFSWDDGTPTTTAAATTTGVAPATMTSTLSRTSSAARSASRSNRPSAYR